MASAHSAQTLGSHLVAQTISSVALLESLGVISHDDAQAIRSRLPDPYSPFPALAASQITSPAASTSDLSVSMGGLNVGGGPGGGGDPNRGHGVISPNHSNMPSLPPRQKPMGGEIRARALWDYSGAEADDLAFRQNDVIIIDEEVNEQWYRGRVIPGGQQFPIERSGLFPSNYVEKLAPQSMPYPPGPAAMVPYQHPGPPVPTGGSYYPPNQQLMSPQQQSAGGTVIVQQQEPPKKNKMSGIGGRLGNAAVTGAGFGFGSAIASNIVNAIL